LSLSRSCIKADKCLEHYTHRFGLPRYKTNKSASSAFLSCVTEAFMHKSFIQKSKCFFFSDIKKLSLKKRQVYSLSLHLFCCETRGHSSSGGKTISAAVSNGDRSRGIGSHQSVHRTAKDRLSNGALRRERAVIPVHSYQHTGPHPRTSAWQTDF